MSTLDLYITNTETIYPDYDDPFSDVAVRLYGRTSDQEPKQVTVTGFSPYFYVLAEQRELLQPADHEDVERIEESAVVPLEDRFLPPAAQRDLAKVVAAHPGAIPGLREQYDVTFGADVRFTNRFRIDKEIRSGVRVAVDRPDDDHHIVDHTKLLPIEMSDVEPRMVTLDIETDDRDSGFPDPGDARVLSVAAHDSYTDETIVFLDTDGETIEEKFMLDDGPESLLSLGITEADALKFEPNERQMLIAFASWVSDRDPDILAGWNSGDANDDGFDFPHLIARMKECGASPARLSREGEYDLDNYRGRWTATFKGRSTYDLMDAWASTKFTEPDSKKLDRVAADALDDAKIPHPDMGYYEMYRDDPGRFVNYNVKDTNLTVEIADAENVIAFKKRLKNMVGVDWEEVRENRYFVSMSVRRKCREHGVAMVTARDNPRVQEAAAQDNDEVNYEGAYVFPAFEGVKRNIVGVDLASLYPMTQWMLNASPDTKVDPEWADERDIPYVTAANGVCFRTDVDSIIRELVDEYDEMKMAFKRKRNACEYGTDEWDEMAEAYNVTKTIYNSYYGYTGWAQSPIYDPDVAAAVTLTGQRVIKRTAEWLDENTEGEIAYGDTDSNYLEFPDDWTQQETLEYVEDLCATLTDEVYPDLCEEFDIPREDNRWLIEMEMRAERFFMSSRKKAYAYLKTWDEGDDFDHVVNDGDGKFDVTGYDCVKSSKAQLTREMQREVLESIVTGGSKEDVAERVFAAASSIDYTDPDWEYIGIPQGLGKDISKEKAYSDDYYNWSKTRDTPQDAHPRGAWFANHLLNVEYSKGSKPMKAYVKETLVVDGEPVDVLCYEYDDDLDPVADDLQLDAEKMRRTLIMNPMGDVLRAFDLEPEAAIRGDVHTQQDLGSFV